jgi:hypothetical protein
VEQLKPALMAWLEQHRKEVLRLATAVCEKETWQETPPDGQFIATSATEILRVPHSALDSLLQLDIPIHGTVMRSELEVIAQVVALYGQCVCHGCENPRRLVRPQPPLTRYKNSLAVKAQAGKDVLRCSSSCCQMGSLAAGIV